MELDPKKVFVANLPLDVDSSDLKAFFEARFASRGDVVGASIARDRDSGDSRGFGFVQFEFAEDALAAVTQGKGMELQGRKLDVKAAIQKPPRHVREHAGARR